MPQIAKVASAPEGRAFRMQEVIPVSKSKPYSSVPVKGVDVESLAKAHAGQACVLGVDVAKVELMAVLRWPDGLVPAAVADGQPRRPGGAEWRGGTGTQLVDCGGFAG